jgi:hypothetical protein
MLRYALRDRGILLQEFLVFFYAAFGNRRKKPVLGYGQIALHQNPECTLEPWRLEEKRFLCFRGKSQQFAIFQGFDKNPARLVFIDAERYIADPRIFCRKLQNHFMSRIVDVIAAQTAFDHERFKIAHFAFMKHNCFFWNGFVLEQRIESLKFLSSESDVTRNGFIDLVVQGGRFIRGKDIILRIVPVSKFTENVQRLIRDSQGNTIPSLN